MIHIEGLENAIPYLLMRITMQMRNLDQKTRNRIAKETLKEFPDSRKTLKEARCYRQSTVTEKLVESARSTRPKWRDVQTL